MTTKFVNGAGTELPDPGWGQDTPLDYRVPIQCTIIGFEILPASNDPSDEDSEDECQMVIRVDV